MPDERNWSYTGSTSPRKKRQSVVEPPPPVQRRPLRRHNPRLVQERLTTREILGIVVGGLVALAFLAILFQFDGWLAAGIGIVVALLMAWEVQRLVRKSRRRSVE